MSHEILKSVLGTIFLLYAYVYKYFIDEIINILDYMYAYV